MAQRTNVMGAAMSHQPPDKLRAILHIAQQLNAEHDRSTLLHLIAREAARILDAELASLFLLDPGRGELWSRVTLDTEETLRFDANQGVAGEVVRSGEIIQVDDVSHDPRFFAGIDASTGFRTRNVLAVPVRNLRGEIIGVFEVLNKRSGVFSPEDVEAARLLVGQASIALETAQLVGTLKRDRDELSADNARLAREVESKFPMACFLGASEPIRAVVRLIEQVADSSIGALILGESGTGKELVAKSIHYNSPRARRPLVALNCAALPEALVESEMFGVEKGVATGVEARAGKFEEANRGTLFLDEIGDLSMPAQAKLLRVLQERIVERVGGRRAIPIDVRVLAATNKDLPAAIEAGSFREDLYYRLNAITISLPALRDVRADIPLMASCFLAKHCRESNRPPPPLAPETLAALVNYRWPGNVRQLDNEMRRLAVTARGDRVELSDLSAPVRAAGDEPAAPSGAGLLKDAVTELERRMIAAALDTCQHNQHQTARALGLSRQGLIKKIKRYGLAKRPS
jgi:Nif-specific regulatory protein